MPNHTSNNIIFNEPLTDKDIKKIKQELFNEGNNLDFNKLIPQPKRLILTSTNEQRIKAYSWYFTKNPDNLSEEELNKTLDSENAIREIENKYYATTRNEKISIEKDSNYIKLYNWYDWNVENWGTKWGAYGTTISKDILFFNTAWTMPSNELLVKLFEKLKKILPQKTFNLIKYEVEYENECGIEVYKYIDGEIEFIEQIDNEEYEGDE